MRLDDDALIAITLVVVLVVVAFFRWRREETTDEEIRARMPKHPPPMPPVPPARPEPPSVDFLKASSDTKSSMNFIVTSLDLLPCDYCSGLIDPSKQEYLTRFAPYTHSAAKPTTILYPESYHIHCYDRYRTLERIMDNDTQAGTNTDKTPFRWAQIAPGNPAEPDHAKGYECSSSGDKRFSAFFARMADGRSIEEHYQCDIKAYQPGGTDTRLGKGKPHVSGDTQRFGHPYLWKKYLQLWIQWAGAHPDHLEELYHRARDAGNLLTDKFATTEINQAHALAMILNDRYCDIRLPALS